MTCSDTNIGMDPGNPAGDRLIVHEVRYCDDGSTHRKLLREGEDYTVDKNGHVSRVIKVKL